MLKISTYIKLIIGYVSIYLSFFKNKIIYKLLNVVDIKSNGRSYVSFYVMFLLIKRIDDWFYRFTGNKYLSNTNYYKRYYYTLMNHVVFSVLYNDTLYFVHKENIYAGELFKTISYFTIDKDVIDYVKRCKNHKSIKWIDTEYINVFNNLICDDDILISNILLCLVRHLTDGEVVITTNIYDDSDDIPEFKEIKKKILVFSKIKEIYNGNRTE